ncbi:hypothetical protein C6499_08380 [Candidatus Poribacteria bacterium]|nr:MAG: hypothetical protein C6499_08380 [Candidatus Poribacteria bacterium]
MNFDLVPIEELQEILPALYKPVKEGVRRFLFPLLEDYKKFKNEQENHDPQTDDCIREAINMIVNESEFRKANYIANLVRNTVLRSDSELSNSDVLVFLSDIKQMSWRQLCLLEGFRQHRSKIEINAHRISDLLRKEIQRMVDLDYIHVRQNGLQYEIVDPENINLSSIGHQLCNLMELSQIPDSDIHNTFIQWGYKRVYSE